MNKTVLITGGTGLIGKPLTTLLLSKGYAVHQLSRTEGQTPPGVKGFLWNVKTKWIDNRCIEGVDTIIHLAGEGIAAKPWTNKQKRIILDSRTESIRLIYNLLKQNPEHQVKHLISASATGYYGNRGDEILAENSTPGDDFLSKTCIAWENAVNEAKEQKLAVSILRTGIVLSKKGGALAPIARTIKMGLGAPLGSGRQWMPWIHLNDLVNMYAFVLENSVEGTFNATAPDPVTNAVFTKAVARQLGKSLWLPAVPAFALRVLMGEMCAVVLNSDRVSAEKIKNAGFKFVHEDLNKALEDIYA